MPAGQLFRDLGGVFNKLHDGIALLLLHLASSAGDSRIDLNLNGSAGDGRIGRTRIYLHGFPLARSIDHTMASGKKESR